MTHPLPLWIGFHLFILAMLALDLGVFHKKKHVVRLREALIWSAIWISTALLFNLGIYLHYGADSGLEFLTGYLIEKSLSVDNIFIFLTIFTYFQVPRILQHKVLFWGILGALVLRATFIIAGITLIEKFHWIIFVFGGFLILTGLRTAFQAEKEIHPEHNPLIRVIRGIIPVTKDFVDDHFFVKSQGKWMATPLFIALAVVETTDVIFAVDSIPAILAVTSDPFIVYTSNVFAILGLRTLYFALSGTVEKFHYIKYGLSVILIFVGTKMVISDVYKVPIGVSLATIAIILVVSILASVMRWNRKNPGPPRGSDPG